MSKRRKYDLKNKRSFIIILILSIAIIGIFSLFIYNYSKASKIEYLIESGSVLQDIEKNYISIDDDAILKVRWDGSYYLIYNDEKINLGKKVIAYNTITKSINLYGTFYEILSDGKIIENKNETVLENTSIPKFYKLDDREYLLVDSKINSSDNSIETNNYLLVELDKVGNAKLSNNGINLKTISPTTLVTSAYTFDIANEILNFGEYDIDLKKIIGSTNQYVPDSGKEEGNGSGMSGSGNATGGDGTSSGLGTGTGTGIGSGAGNGPGDIINDSDIGSIPEVDDIINKFKKTSIVNLVEGLTQIDVDYVIYDPYNEYKSVYVDVIRKDATGGVVGTPDKIYLTKNDTHVTISNLVPNTTYELRFTTVSSIADETGVVGTAPDVFDTFNLTTKSLDYSMSIYKLLTSEKKLVYKVNLQNDFEISKVNVKVDIEDTETETPLECLGKSNYVEIDSDDIYNGYAIGNIDIPDSCVIDNTVFNLMIDTVEKDDGTLFTINRTFTYALGGVQ